MKIVHMTTVHPRNDVRVLHKQCQTLASAGHEVSLLVADGEGDAQAGRVRIIDIGRRASRRLKRALVTGAAMYRAARRIGADVYHFHDPELLPWAALLRLGGQRVVYDAHEHLADDIMAKPYLSPRQKRLFGFTVAPLEQFLAGRMSAVVGATPSIVARFEGRAPRTVGVFNFPLEEEMKGAPGPIAGRQRQACYVGGIGIARGVRELIAAAQLCRTKIVLAGPLWDGLTVDDLSRMPGYAAVDYRGQISRQEVAALMGSSRAGIVTFLPTPYHVEALPNKIFEYMSAGIPVVASDFPFWRSLVEATGSGLCVDPCDPAAIAAAIDRIADDTAFADECGRRGSAAVAREYNWTSQGRKLAALYDALYDALGDRRG